MCNKNPISGWHMPLVLLLFFSGITCLVRAQTYVTPAGAGLKNGTSWANAYMGTQLQTAITNASAGSEVWVAAGTYKPNAVPSGATAGGSSRNYTFKLKNGVAVYGGFAGTETLLSMRNVNANVTILSGDIGTVNNASDNCYHVVVTPWNDNTAILDGFTIRDGNANGPNTTTISFFSGAISASAADGGGIHCLNGGGPTIRNCTFTNNFATNSGGGIFHYNGASYITYCTFKFNKAVNGAGVYYESCSAGTLTNCTLTDNNATYGGGIYTYNSTNTISDCVFLRDTATMRGGAIYNLYASPPISNCTFSFNRAPNDGGGAVYNAGYTASIINCNFDNNYALYGGAVENYNSSGTVYSSCNFTSNQTAGSGGSVYNEGVNAQFTNCNFTGNTASNSTGGGGAVCNINCNPVFTNCQFTQNMAQVTTGRGGAVYNYAANAVMSKCVFWQNSATGTTGRGGAVANEAGSSGTYSNCIFWANTSVNTGGGVYNTASSPTIANCTFYGNTASGGGGIQNSSSSGAVIFNVILWGNTVGGINNSSSTPAVTYSTVQGTLYAGTGNLNVDPLFVNPANPIGADGIWATADDGLMLLCTSPAVDAGTSASAPATDIIGTSRPQGKAFDMGAYEQTNTPSYSADSLINNSPPLCVGSVVHLGVSGGFLGSNANWEWYSGGCNGSHIASGDAITVSPRITTTYYAKAEGSCNIAACDSVIVVPDTCFILYAGLLNFNASLYNQLVKLTWTMTSQPDVDHYEIERSTDQNKFTRIGSVRHNGQKSTISFSYDDNITNLTDAIFYYRIKVVEWNGSGNYSRVLSVKKKITVAGLILPNPVTENTVVTINAPVSSIAEIMIFDMSGKLMYKQKQPLRQGQNTCSLQGMKKLPEATYVLQATINGEIVRRKFIIQ